MNDYTVALVRTVVNIAVGSAVTWLEARGVHVDSQTSASLVIALTGLNAAAIYGVIHYLERYTSPKFGWLLGMAKMPSYDGIKPEQPTGK